MWANLEAYDHSNGRCFCVVRTVFFKNKILCLNTSNQVTYSLIYLFPLWLSFVRDPDFSPITYMPSLWMYMCSSSEKEYWMCFQLPILFLLIPYDTVCPSFWNSVVFVLSCRSPSLRWWWLRAGILRQTQTPDVCYFLVLWSWAWYTASLDLSCFLVSLLQCYCQGDLR